MGAELNEMLQYDFYIDSNLQNFIACRTSHALLSHMENYHKLSHHNLINKTIMPGCRCTNKESCSIKNKHETESASDTPPSSKELNSWECPRALSYKCRIVILFNHHIKGWKSIQPSPILLLAHHKLQFYYPVNDLHKTRNFTTIITSKEHQSRKAML